MLKLGLVQLNVSPDPAQNLPVTEAYVHQAADAGARFVLTPEVTNFIAENRTQQAELICFEADDPTLVGLRTVAKTRGIWVLIGSLSVKTNAADGRYANRSFLIAPSGEIAARYDKIHMFDVTVSDTETYHESATYQPGDQAVLAQVDGVSLGMTICYDLRFPDLYQRLALSGAQIITVPSAFSPVTGAAHWEVLLRARAIETGCFILAPAQTGTHTHTKRPRKTWGHTMVVSPWGEVLADFGIEPGVTVVEIDLADVETARARMPSLSHIRTIVGP